MICIVVNFDRLNCLDQKQKAFKLKPKVIRFERVNATIKYVMVTGGSL